MNGALQNCSARASASARTSAAPPGRPNAREWSPRRLSYRVIVEHLRIADARRVVDFVSETGTVTVAEPFPPPVLERLAEVIPCIQLLYWDYDLGFDVDRSEPFMCSHGLEFPPAVNEAVRAFGHQLDAVYGRSPDAVIKLSDLISRSELVSLDFYQGAMRPVGVEDELKLLLDAGPPRHAGFSFLLDRRYSERDRLVLDLLAKHLSDRRERAALKGNLRRSDVELTEREWEVLEWLAQGRTNKEIAATILISPNTVRKHLERAFDKLGVHTRTAAVARAFVSLPR